MAVFRVERNTGYTVMSNHHLRNKELSLKAKGLLSQMLSLPEDWDYTLAGLSHINREKIDAIREAVKELEKAGYIVRSRERDEKGRLRGADYVIYEQPQPREPEAATSGGQPPILDLPTLENPTLDNPTLEKPTQEKPTLENPTQLNKDILSKEQSITDLSSTDSIPFHSLNPLPFAHGEAATPPERKRTEAKSNSAVEIYNFHITDMSREQIEAAGFGFHHASEDGKYLIMGNGTQAYAIAAEQPQRDNPLKHVEDTIEQNDNNFDGLINNTPQTPTVADFEQRAKAGEAISVTDLAKAVKAEKREQPQKKPSILKKLDEYKKQAAQQPKDKQKEHKKDLEV